MDVLKFLQGGNQTPNPKYNPKLKGGYSASCFS